MNSTATQEHETVSLPVICLPPDFEAVSPRTKSVLNVARQMGVQATHAALRSNRRIFLLHQNVELEEGEEATPEHLHTVGTVANITESYEPDDGTIRIAIASEHRGIGSILYLRNQRLRRYGVESKWYLRNQRLRRYLTLNLTSDNCSSFYRD